MARRHTGQVWLGDNSSTNTTSWPPILGSSSNSSSIVGGNHGVELIAEIESKMLNKDVCCLEKLGYLAFIDMIGFRFGSR